MLETLKLYSVTQCDSDACLIIRFLCKMESPSNQKLVANSNIAYGADFFGPAPLLLNVKKRLDQEGDYN